MRPDANFAVAMVVQFVWSWLYTEPASFGGHEILAAIYFWVFVALAFVFAFWVAGREWFATSDWGVAQTVGICVVIGAAAATFLAVGTRLTASLIDSLADYHGIGLLLYGVACWLCGIGSCLLGAARSWRVKGD